VAHNDRTLMDMERYIRIPLEQRPTNIVLYELGKWYKPKHNCKPPEWHTGRQFTCPETKCKRVWSANPDYSGGWDRVYG
jgi:hypothetical protein